MNIFLAIATYPCVSIQITFDIELFIYWYIMHQIIKILPDFLLIHSSILVCGAQTLMRFKISLPYKIFTPIILSFFMHASITSLDAHSCIITPISFCCLSSLNNTILILVFFYCFGSISFPFYIL